MPAEEISVYDPDTDQRFLLKYGEIVKPPGDDAETGHTSSSCFKGSNTETEDITVTESFEERLELEEEISDHNEEERVESLENVSPETVENQEKVSDDYQNLNIKLQTLHLKLKLEMNRKIFFGLTDCPTGELITKQEEVESPRIDDEDDDE